jgi:hypothetical protein
MSTTRQNILSQIETDLNTISSLKKVMLNQSSVLDLETVPLPCAFIYSGPETRVDGVIGYENWSWKIYIEVWARDTEMEDLLNDIHTKMFTDERLGTYADKSFRTGVDLLFLDPERSLQDMIIEYEILFKHVKGIM